MGSSVGQEGVREAGGAALRPGPGGGTGAAQGRLWPPLRWPQKTWYVWELSF